MTETTQPESQAKPEQKLNSFHDVLRSLQGKIVTMVNPESYEDAPVGHRLTTGFYKAKVLETSQDFIVVATEYVHKHGEKAKEPVKQFIPIARVKRVSIMKGDRLIHL